MGSETSGSGRLLLVLGVVVTVVLAFGAVGCAPATEDDGETGESEAAEPAAPVTALEVQGQGATVRIEPTVDTVISGIVTITITESPDGTVMAFFAMRPQGGDASDGEGPNIGIDQDGSDGWSSLLDTTGFENGVYEVSGLAMADADSNPLGGATIQVQIEN